MISDPAYLTRCSLDSSASRTCVQIDSYVIKKTDTNFQSSSFFTNASRRRKSRTHGSRLALFLDCSHLLTRACSLHLLDYTSSYVIIINGHALPICMTIKAAVSFTITIAETLAEERVFSLHVSKYSNTMSQRNIGRNIVLTIISHT